MHPPWAVEILTNFFELNNYPTREDVGQLAAETDLHEKSVRKWFEKRRRRLRDNRGEIPQKQKK